MWKVWGLLVLSALLLTGCSDIPDIQRSVDESNRRVEFLKESYDASFIPAKEIENTILTSIQSGVVSEELNAQSDKSFNSDDLKRVVTAIYASLNAYVTHNNTLAEMDNAIPKLSIADTVRSGTDVYYFFDDTTGKLEQMFVLRSEEGKIHKLSLLWLGGVCYEIK